MRNAHDWSETRHHPRPPTRTAIREKQAPRIRRPPSGPGPGTKPGAARSTGRKPQRNRNETSPGREAPAGQGAWDKKRWGAPLKVQAHNIDTAGGRALAKGMLWVPTHPRTKSSRSGDSLPRGPGPPRLCDSRRVPSHHEGQSSAQGQAQTASTRCSSSAGEFQLAGQVSSISPRAPPDPRVARGHPAPSAKRAHPAAGSILRGVWESRAAARGGDRPRPLAGQGDQDPQPGQSRRP